ncbi:MAG: prepilin-type N-terminal cleavage/methylation domain-containing protein [bacterium]|nr:MAG: prepilin-type N-terminal cleavage/methylation domain-containing protein [bacterium]
MKKKLIKGLSLVEILIVISIFAVIGLLSTRSVFLTLRGAKKSDSLVRVRENINYSLAVMERQIRSAQSVTCPNLSPTVLDYVSIEGSQTSFSCTLTGSDRYIASGSARLTSNDVSLLSCNFSCTQDDINTPPVVRILLEATDSQITSVEAGTVTAQTEIVLRNY